MVLIVWFSVLGFVLTHGRNESSSVDVYSQLPPGFTGALQAKGVTFYSDVNVVDEGPLAGWRWCYFSDPDGLALELVKDVARKVDRNEYKRQQAAPGLKVTSKAFGIGRRFPIAQRYFEG